MIVLATLALLALIPKAHALSRCGDRADIVKRLTDTYQERLRGRGIQADGQLFEVLVSEKGTWSAIVTAPRGPTCVVSVGENWQFIKDKGESL